MVFVCFNLHLQLEFGKKKLHLNYILIEEASISLIKKQNKTKLTINSLYFTSDKYSFCANALKRKRYL